MKKFLRSAALILMLAFILGASGCEMSVMEVDNFMRPPAATGDSAAIQQALNSALGTPFTLRYPRSGEHRSAVVMADLDADEDDEAIVFYRLSTENSGAHMIVLDSDEDGTWHTAGKAEPTGGEIDRVLLGDINGDGANDIISGWMLPDTNNRIIKIHMMQNGILLSINIAADSETNYPSDKYSEMVTGDYDGDSRNEIITVYRSFSDGITIARMLRLGYNLEGAVQLSPVGSVQLDSSIYTYINAQSGNFSFSGCGMVLDGCRSDGKYVSEVVFWDSTASALIAPTNNPETHEAVSFIRSLPTLSRDINNDGLIELPTDEMLPGYSETSESPIYLTSWYKLFDLEIKLVLRAVMRIDQGYFLTFPSDWEDKVTAQPDTNSSSMYFYLAEPDRAFSNELFRIKIFTLDEWQNLEKQLDSSLIPGIEEQAPAYQMLARTDYYVYGVLISSASEGSELTLDEISAQFHLVS